MMRVDQRRDDLGDNLIPQTGLLTPDDVLHPVVSSGDGEPSLFGNARGRAKKQLIPADTEARPALGQSLG